MARLSMDRRIAVWLFAVAAMVFVMVVLGGMTRLTESGLSMTEWRPVTGWLPPMSDAEWQAVFAGYRMIPEYREVNPGMTLEAFKQIFWLEYIHRLWGRLIGVAFAAPFFWFAATGQLDRRRLAILSGLLILGGIQGGVGWYMVQSGLSERTDVSQYRLALHLAVAVVIYAGLLKAAFWLYHGRAAQPAGRRGNAMRPWIAALWALFAAAFATIVAGAFVAGLNAGMTYNTFPLMDGEWIPSGLYAAEHGLAAAFEDVTTVQFNHRVLATFTLAGVLVFWISSARLEAKRFCRATGAVACIAALQFLLGVSTLLSVVRIDLAVLHQAGAILLITALVYAIDRFERG